MLLRVKSDKPTLLMNEVTSDPADPRLEASCVREMEGMLVVAETARPSLAIVMSKSMLPRLPAPETVALKPFPWTENRTSILSRVR